MTQAGESTYELTPVVVFKLQFLTMGPLHRDGSDLVADFSKREGVEKRRERRERRWSRGVGRGKEEESP